MSITATHIHKAFGSFQALRDVSVDFPTGQLVALLGPSGSGKTSLLRIIAGLEKADSGQVLFDGEDATTVNARNRGVGFVFQHYALFRHMTVFENIAFGLRVKPRAVRPARAVIDKRVNELLRLVQLDPLGNRLPSQLSGGQRQRVALARALAVEPKVLLLDEPFGALDAKVRKELRQWLRRLHDEIHVTSIFVTHDVEEALEVSDRIVVMNQGRVEQAGTPDEVYENPATPFVHDFLGSVNVLPSARGESYVRPHDLVISRTRTTVEEMRAVVSEVRAVGPVVRITVQLDGGGSAHAEITRAAHRELAVTPGETIFLHPRNQRIYAEDYSI
ncbi:MAG: sulfate ABC transporter ATP-binding protein [Kiritimatiellia bacterium]